MKKIFVFSLLLTSLSLSGCSFFKIATDIIDKESVVYNYKDYCDNNVYNIDATPSSGSPKLLVIPIWFTDSSSYIPTSQKETVRSDIQKAYFGNNSDVGWRSVTTYYQELSHDEVTLTGTVSDWYSCGHSSSYYYSGTSTTTSLVTEAVEWYRSSHGDLTEFDLDKNGYLDGVMLIYAAPDYGALKNSSANNLWAYCYWMQVTNPNTSAPTPNAFFWASYDFMYGSGYSIGSYTSGDNSHSKIDTHTYIHEMGHMFGLSDYYDYSDFHLSPAGGFSMQDYNVGSHDPYSALALGWANVYVPTESCTLEIKDFQSSGDVILLSNKFHNSPFDEYFLLELYTPTGLNKFDCEYQYQSKYPVGPNLPGIRVWHVDARLLYLDNLSSDYSTNRITTAPSAYKKVTHMMSNTYHKNESDTGYISPLGSSYANYNLLQLIRNSSTINYRPTKTMTYSNLFTTGDSFSMNLFAKQFYKNGKLNSGDTFKWEFTVKHVSNSSATITLTKV